MSGSRAVSLPLFNRRIIWLTLLAGGALLRFLGKALGGVMNRLYFFLLLAMASNANSALVVTVPVEHFPEGPLGGLDYQKALEVKCFEATGGRYQAPVQLW